jgi:hypothetical protein
LKKGLALAYARPAMAWGRGALSMIPKSGYRFSDKIMLKQ